MKLVVFSDIHGNVDALKKLLIIEPPSKDCQYIFCGDVAGYYYYVRECIDILWNVERLVAVRGNHDQMYIDAFYNSSMTERLIMEYGSSYKDKDAFAVKYLSSLPIQYVLKIDGKDIVVQHGTPECPLEGRIYPNTDAEKIVDTSADIVLLGHTHYCMHRVINHTHWINPGSLGQPRDGLGFSYCIITTKPFLVEFKRFELNIGDLKKLIKIKDIQNPYLWEIFERRKEEE